MVIQQYTLLIRKYKKRDTFTINERASHRYRIYKLMNQFIAVHTIEPLDFHTFHLI